MANEYLKRTPTSTGNRKKWTWSGWIKINKDFGSSDYNTVWSVAAGTSADNSDRFHLYHYADGRWGTTGTSSFSQIFTGPGGSAAHSRDPSSWIHICLSVDTTTSSLTPDKIQRFWVNGIEYNYDDVGNIAANANLAINGLYEHYIGNRNSNVTRTFDGQMTDLFLVDGQALTPDVFGFYKEGKGYVSAGSTQSTDFRPGQWVPKAPRIIKSEIERRGGFGVNGFYLPMNSSNNFGADFHTTPNTILKLKEDLPQPKSEIDGVGDYTGALRDDPFKQYLVAAIPGVSGGLNNGFGDYSHIIRGTGNPLTVSRTNAPSISSDASVYYGSSIKLIRANSQDIVITGFNNAIGSGDFTIEGWFRFDSRAEDFNAFNLYQGTTRKFFMQARISPAAPLDFHTRFVGTGNEYNSQVIGWNNSHIGIWYHYAISRNNGTLRFFLNGVCVGVHLNHTENIGSVDTLRIGYMSGDGTKYLDGYFQDIRYYTVGKYTSGFDVPKPYTPVGIATWRAVPDCTANNFCTWNPLNQIGLTFANGNLTTSEPGSSGGRTYGTMGSNTGKWYYEAYVEDVGTPNTGGTLIGINPLIQPSSNVQNRTAYRSEGSIYNDSGTNVGNSSLNYVAGDIIGVAWDADNKRLWFAKNNTWVLSGNPAGGSNPAITYTNTETQGPFIVYDNGTGAQVTHTNFGQNPTFSGKVANVVRVNSSNSSWDQTPNTGSHNDWTISNEGRDLNVVVSAGFYARAYLYLDPNEKYLLSFNYISGPANLGILSDTSGYLRATDGSLSPNGLSAGNSYTFEISNSNWVNFTGFNSQTYDINNIYLTRVVSGYQDSNGKGEFRYQPPTGFLALCEDNLPTPAISDPGEYFKTVLYTGSQTPRSIQGLGFQPDLVWIKVRSEAGSHVLFDSVRGPALQLRQNSTDAEVADTVNLTSFDDDGFSLGSGYTTVGTNGSGRTYVAWCWKAGGEAVSNTDGSITSQVSVNQDAGFSIVSWTGNGATTEQTIGHGLNKSPSFTIIKARDTASFDSSANEWWVYFGSNDLLRARLNNPNSAFFNNNDSGVWNGTYSNRLRLIANGPFRENNIRYIAYAWAEIEGYSKFGSYVGNGSDDGPFVYCGFKPAWVMIKNASVSGYWNIWDSSRSSTNFADRVLFPNVSDIEQVTNPGVSNYNFDFLSNGFKIRTGSAGHINGSGNTIIFVAFAESPFQTANSK